MATDEPGGILRVGLGGGLQVFHALVEGDELPLGVEAEVVNPSLVVGIQIVLLAIGGDGVDIGLASHRGELPKGLGLVGVKIESGVVAQLRTVDAVVVAKLGVEAIAALGSHQLDVETILAQLGAGGPVGGVLDVVLQPLACLYLIEIERATLGGQLATRPRRCLGLHHGACQQTDT